MQALKTFQEVSSKFGDYAIEIVASPAASVELISHSIWPEEAIHIATRGYTGTYESNPRIGDYGVDQAFEDIAKTKLQTPYEMIHTLWLIRNVTRAFTHQLVRYRVGTAFIQESMRFVGHKGLYRVLATHSCGHGEMLELYAETARSQIIAYVKLLEQGAEGQDARGLLPTNILTHIFFDCSLRTLQNIIPQRLCCQAQQGEWQPILKQMRHLIEKTMGPRIEKLLRAPYELGESCGYRASFDRPCIWGNE